MSEPAQHVEVRLAEIDRQLREIQSELVPGRVPRETQTPMRALGAGTAPPPSGHSDLGWEQGEAELSAGPSELAREHGDVEAPRGSSGSAWEVGPERQEGRFGPLAEALLRARRARAAEAPVPEPGRDPAEAAALGTRPRGPLPRPARIIAPPPPTGVVSGLQSSLLAAMRELLDGYERAVSRAGAADELQLTISAGPFSGTDALHAFEQAVSEIQGVLEVAVSGYEGRDHAILDVRLKR